MGDEADCEGGEWVQSFEHHRRGGRVGMLRTVDGEIVILSVRSVLEHQNLSVQLPHGYVLQILVVPPRSLVCHVLQ